MSAERCYTLAELRELAETWLDYRRGEHPDNTVKTDRTKVKSFLDWLEHGADQGG